MALIKDSQLFNITFKNAYHVVKFVNYLKQKNDDSANCALGIDVFSNESSNEPLNAEPLVYKFSIRTDLATQNPIKKGYEYLKTLLEYQDSTDA